MKECQDVAVEVVTDAIARELPRLLLAVESLLADAILGKASHVLIRAPWTEHRPTLPSAT
jgi:hypothetical protein